MMWQWVTKEENDELVYVANVDDYQFIVTGQKPHFELQINRNRKVLLNPGELYDHFVTVQAAKQQAIIWYKQETKQDKPKPRNPHLTSGQKSILRALATGGNITVRSRNSGSGWRREKIFYPVRDLRPRRDTFRIFQQNRWIERKDTTIPDEGVRDEHWYVTEAGSDLARRLRMIE